MISLNSSLALALAISLSIVIFENAYGNDTDMQARPFGIIGVPSGTGEYDAIAVSDSTLPMNTLYMPVNLPEKALPLLLWSNGGCRDNGLLYSQFLREVASHGFFIVAAGYPRHERALRPMGMESTQSSSSEREELTQTGVDQLYEAIDWAIAQNNEPNSAYHQKIDTNHIGAMGTSCGGLHVIELLTDTRVATGIAFNSGLITRSSLPERFVNDPNFQVDKSALLKLQGPIAYINGGPSDIAYVNAEDDFRLIKHVPVFFAENGVGHSGTYLFDEHGGEYAVVARAWMSWQLKNDADAGKWFLGKDCSLCVDPGWKVRSKGINQ